jgi:hypothetical protein
LVDEPFKVYRQFIVDEPLLLDEPL